MNSCSSVTLIKNSFLFFIDLWPYSEDRTITGLLYQYSSKKGLLIPNLLPEKTHYFLALVHFHASAGQHASCSDYHVSWSKFAKVGLVTEAG